MDNKSIILSGFFCFSLLTVSSAKADEFRIAAASSFQFALNEVIEKFSEQQGQNSPTVVYGSSGNLFRQIVQGAPFEIFITARGELTSELLDLTISKDAGETIGAGRLVLLSGKSFGNSHELTDIIKTEIAADKNKLAIANPAHAPYGRAAVQMLETLGLWEEARSFVVNGEQVSQATRYVVSGAAAYGLVSLSLAVSPAIASNTEYLLVDESLHDPIDLRVVRLNSASDHAQRFYDFILSDEAVDEIFTRYGLR